MKLSSLKWFRVVAFFVSLGLSVSQAEAASQPQPLASPSLLLVKMDTLPLSHQLAIFPTESSDRAILFDLVQELRTLPVGKEYEYYLQILEQRGYLILSNYIDHQHWEFTLEKTQQNIRLLIAYHPGTKMSTMITASGPRVAAQDPYSQLH